MNTLNISTKEDLEKSELTFAELWEKHKEIKRIYCRR